MSTPDETMLTVTCGVCDDALIHVATPCASETRGLAPTLLVCTTCGTRQTHPRRQSDYFGVVMRVRPTSARAMPRRARSLRAVAL